MNLRRMTIAMTMALFVSGLCTYMLSRKVNAQANKVVAEQKYVGTARTMEAGEILKADSLELLSWPASNPVPGAFVKPEDLVGRSLLYPMMKGQPITDKYVTAVGAGVGLAARIPDGMRAIALRSDEVMGVAGFLAPGSHVDVLVTYHTEKTPEPATTTVLQDAEVIAAGQKVQPDPEGKPATVTVVTLLLTPQDAERAVLASTQGTIHFVLRSGSDRGKVEGEPIVMSELSGSPATTSAVTMGSTLHVSRVDAHPESGRTGTRTAARREIVVETIMGDKQTSSTFVMGGRQ